MSAKTKIIHDSHGQPIVVKIIKTPEDRAAHIAACKQSDVGSPWGTTLTSAYYEKVGDQASVNGWYYHDPETGFNRLYANTPDWIVELARKMRWIDTRGERVLE